MNAKTQSASAFTLLRNTLVASLMVAGTATAQAADLQPNTIYVTDSDSLYAVDETRGTAVRVGEAQPSLSYILDIDFDASGKLYGLTGLMQFFSFDAASSRMVEINGFTSSGRTHSGFAFHNGAFYAAESTGLEGADPEAGSFTIIGSYGLGAREYVTDLASGSDGMLYASVRFPPDYYGYRSADFLATLNTTTGEMNLIGSTYIYDLEGLTEKDGVLYGIGSGGDLYQIDKVSGFSTLIAAGVVPGAFGMATSPTTLPGFGTTGAGGSGGGAMSLPLMLLIVGIVCLRRVGGRKISSIS